MSDHKELYDYRARLLAKMISASQEFCTLCREAQTGFDPLNLDGWNLHQIAAHVRDVNEMVYGARLRCSVGEEHSVFQNFESDAWLHGQYAPDESLEKILGEFSANVLELVGWLETLPPEAWSRLSRHEVYGEFAMQSWAEHSLAHLVQHLKSIQEHKTTI